MFSRINNITTWLAVLLIFLSGCGGGGESSPAAAPPAAAVSVSGTITAASNSFIDSDVNDPAAPYAPNDISAQAQILQNPFILGGYTNSITDRLDYYNVDLAQGQVITLSISDHSAANDLSLFLKIPGAGTTIDSSETITELETLTVPVDDNYDIVVEAVSGGSKYVLTISAAVSLLAPRFFQVEDDFVPGEMIVRFKNSDLWVSSLNTFQSSTEALGLADGAVAHGRPLRIDMKDFARRQSILTALGIKRNRLRAPAHTPADEKKFLKQDTLDAIRALRSRPDIASADPNYIRKPTIVPNDQYYPVQWHYPLINLPQAWDIAADPSGIIVAVVDTGVFMAHPDLAANLLPTGYDFISDSTRALDNNGIDPDPDDPGDSPHPGFSSFHGTHVAGTIAAQSGNTTGVAGVSWDGVAETSRILPVRVLGLGGGTSYDVIQGVRYAAGLSNDSPITLNQAQRADIINLSLTGSNYSQAEQATYTEVRNNGVLCIAAAGNENSNVLRYPASYDDVISVSAVDLNREKAWYSNYGTGIDIAAPGGDNWVDNNGDGYADGVLSTLVDDSSGIRQPIYAFHNGTSMATPHVAGVVALMKAIYPDLSPEHFFDELFQDNILKTGQITDDLTDNGPAIRDDTFGYGLIDALKALETANTLAQGGQLPPVLVINPNSLNFGSTLTDLTLLTSKGGGGTLHIISVSGTASWLTVVEDTVDPVTKLGTYRASITINRADLSDAAYATTITFETDTAGTIEVPVTMQVGSAGTIGYNAGFHYVLLIDPDTNNTLYALNATNIGGVYQFGFTNIAAGDYYVVAGTDSDGDNYICGPGEACGGYPTLDQLAPVTVDNDNIIGIDFITGFSVNFSSAATTAAHIPAAGFIIEAQQKTIDTSNY